ncbi:hypothetical protein SERLA73DRAFT_152283 [Serpula lacrymans var. lacrymans S7.3]|uniref:Uncharacterized protein n=1 Tax=Serpula lacrymans var. lacrymans (strain S7.3) TaxID=936435 RepID=F8PVS6_SERL3|nr:hypothetical protein SERLA73DRAFT_152283 [Serpula lacrymans var. lacrymans S7.3]
MHAEQWGIVNTLGMCKPGNTEVFGYVTICGKVKVQTAPKSPSSPSMSYPASLLRLLCSLFNPQLSATKDCIQNKYGNNSKWRNDHILDRHGGIKYKGDIAIWKRMRDWAAPSLVLNDLPSGDESLFDVGVKLQLACWAQGVQPEGIRSTDSGRWQHSWWLQWGGGCWRRGIVSRVGIDMPCDSSTTLATGTIESVMEECAGDGGAGPGRMRSGNNGQDAG